MQQAKSLWEIGNFILDIDYLIDKILYLLLSQLIKKLVYINPFKYCKIDMYVNCKLI
jgi:hypothetical protein